MCARAVQIAMHSTILQPIFITQLPVGYCAKVLLSWQSTRKQFDQVMASTQVDMSRTKTSMLGCCAHIHSPEHYYHHHHDYHYLWTGELKFEIG